MSLSTEERRAQEERDKNSIKSSECGGHIMLWNSIRWVDSVEAQHRPIYGKEEQVILEGSCIPDRHRVKLKGVLIVQSPEQMKKEDEG